MKRRGKKQRNRVLALVLSAAVVLTGITVPGEKTYAAEALFLCFFPRLFT